MAEAKELIVKPISSQDANRIIKSLHYSGKVVTNSQLHFGVFLRDRCGGAMQFGPSLDKRKMLGLVNGTLWNEFLELNRMAFADWLPRNGESRCIGYALRFIRKTYPWIKWVVSFADGTQCGDGTIYRASGFLLTGIKTNTSIWEAPDGMTFTDIGVRTGGKEYERRVFSKTTATKGGHIATTGAASMKRFRDAGCKPKAGFQLRYLYFLHPECRSQLTVPVLPFSEIDRLGAAMYRGKKIVRSAESKDDVAAGHQPAEGGSIPTSALQSIAADPDPAVLSSGEEKKTEGMGVPLREDI